MTVAASILVPGLGHFLNGEKLQGLLWFAICQTLLLLGLRFAGATQLDYGNWFSLGGHHLVFLMIPELGNFLGTQVAALSMHSIELAGRTPELLPLRTLGHLLSGASGVLGCFAAAHAAGLLLQRAEPLPAGRRLPGPALAGLLTLLLPGLGHYVSGRRFKAWFAGGMVLALFLLGMALGNFADFDRQRHPYYWAGQMFLGLPGWSLSWLCAGQRFLGLLPYQDAGLLFTTSAGLFNVILALDAWRRAADDWLRAARGGDRSRSSPAEASA